MPFRFLEPGDPPGTRIPISLTEEQVREILATLDTDLDPAVVEKECLELLQHPENLVSSEDILKEVDAILRDKRSA
ncbi:MAG: hypothetical protein U0793_19030 [Gemmataceae bacterium]